MISSDTVNELLKFEVLDKMINISDHLPVLMMTTFPLMTDHVQPDILVDSNIKQLRLDHANLALYYSYSYACLQPIHDMINSICPRLMADGVELDFGMHCEDINSPHRIECISLIEIAYSKIVHCLINTANQYVPAVKVNSFKFWWDQELDVLKQRATASHHAWIEAGKPNVGALAECRKKEVFLPSKNKAGEG